MKQSNPKTLSAKCKPRSRVCWSWVSCSRKVNSRETKTPPILHFQLSVHGSDRKSKPQRLTCQYGDVSPNSTPSDTTKSQDITNFTNQKGKHPVVESAVIQVFSNRQLIISANKTEAEQDTSCWCSKWDLDCFRLSGSCSPFLAMVLDQNLYGFIWAYQRWCFHN